MPDYEKYIKDILKVYLRQKISRYMRVLQKQL